MTALSASLIRMDLRTTPLVAVLPMLLSLIILYLMDSQIWLLMFSFLLGLHQISDLHLETNFIFHPDF